MDEVIQKRLTDSGVSDEEIQKRLTELGVSDEDLQDPEKVKALAEKIEAENKAKKTPTVENNDKKVLNDQLGRLAKAIAKQATKSQITSTTETQTLSELDVENMVFARTQKLSPEQVEILKDHTNLQKNKGKSFEQIFNSTAAKADLSELKATIEATEELNTNADPDRLLETKNEIVSRYSKTGKTPKSESDQKVVAEAGLEEMGFREF